MKRYEEFARFGVRDPRLSKTAFHEYEERKLINAGEYLRTIQREAIDAVLKRWWEQELRTRDRDEEEVSAAADRLRALCATVPESMLVAEHVCAAIGRDDDAIETRAAAVLLGEAAAAVVQRPEYGVAEFDRIVGVLESNWRAVDAFLSTLKRAETSWPSEQKLAGFAEVPSSLGACMEHNSGLEITGERLRELEAEAREQGVVAYVWGRRQEFALVSRGLSARCKLLANRDWERLVSLAEALPLRELRDGVWQRLRLLEDRDAIVQCLSAGAPVFNDGGWTGHVVALDALKLASEHADLLHAAISALDARLKLERNELPEWFKRVVGEAVRRRDGRRLILLYASELVGEVLHPPWGQPHWSSHGLALDAVSNGLGDAPRADEMRDIGRLSGATQGTREATRLVTGALLGGDPHGYWNWYRALLESSDKELCSQATIWAKGLCYAGPAGVLAAIPEPLREWRAAWAALFVSDRERARFDRVSQTALLPSVHLTRVASALLRSTSFEDRRECLAEVRARVRLLLDYGLHRANVPPLFAGEALEWAFPIFGEGWRKAIGPDAEMIGDDSGRFVFAAKALLDGGVPFGEFEAWCHDHGLDLDRALRETEVRVGHDEALRLHRTAVIDARLRASRTDASDA